MQLPYELLWGVDIAIKKLRPGARFTLYGKNIVDWQDPNQLDPPSWEEIDQQMENDKKLADEWLEKQNVSS